VKFYLHRFGGIARDLARWEQLHPQRHQFRLSLHREKSRSHRLHQLQTTPAYGLQLQFLVRQSRDDNLSHREQVYHADSTLALQFPKHGMSEGRRETGALYPTALYSAVRSGLHDQELYPAFVEGRQLFAGTNFRLTGSFDQVVCAYLWQSWSSDL